MPAQVFTDILARGVRMGHVPNMTKEANRWFRKEARKTRVTPEEVVRDSAGQWRNQAFVGHMYLFAYFAKWRDELPYWDRYPLIFPFSKRKGRFTGINLHYLPPQQRAVLMDRLVELATDNRWNEKTKLRLTYETLKGSSRYRYFKPTIHTYLTSHVKSRLVKVDSADWQTALMLPLQRFEKASSDAVWRDSRAKIGLSRKKRPSSGEIR